MHRPGAVPRPASPRDEGVRTRNASRLEENALKRPRAAREQSPPRYRPRPPPAPPPSPPAMPFGGPVHRPGAAPRPAAHKGNGVQTRYAS